MVLFQASYGCAQPIMDKFQHLKLSQAARAAAPAELYDIHIGNDSHRLRTAGASGQSVHSAGACQRAGWIWTGGICGDIIVIFSILCLPKLGSVETVVFLVLGQIVSGLYIDHFGVFESAVIPMTLLRAVGAVLVFASVVAVSGNIKSDAPEKAKGINFYRFLDFIAGVACSVQIAVNGRLGIVADSAFGLPSSP